MKAGIGHFLGITLLLAGASRPAASQSVSSAWVGDAPIVESVDEIMARDAAIASSSSPKVPVRPRLRRTLAGGAVPSPAAGSNIARSPQIAGPLLPQTLGTSFLAVQSSESAFIPPDTMGCVGPTQILVCVNGRIKLFDRSGTLDTTVLNVTTDSFFSSVRGTTSASDCRVRFDPDSKRWFVVMINTPSTNNRIMIAVSKTATITSSSQFFFYQFQQNLVAPAGNNNQFADYPTLGIDRNALYIGVNMFSNSGAFQGSTGFVVQKSSVLSGGSITATALRGLATGTGAGAYTPQGVDNDDPAAAKGFFVGVDVSSVPSTTMVAVRVLNPGSSSPAPSVDATLNISVPPFGSALGGVPVLGSTTVIDDVDNRLMMAQLKGGNLWTVHAIQVDASGNASPSGGRDGARWYEIAGLLGISPTVSQSGTLFDASASNPSSYFVPSIAASGQGHVALGSTVGGPSEHAEIALSGRLSGDATGTLRAPTIGQTSSTAYNVDPSDPAQRWGDFSFTCVDPNDNMTLWTFQEYCNATNSWGVRVMRLQAPPPATPSSLSLTQVAQNQSSVNVTLTGTSLSGSGFYDPGAGYPNRLGVAVSGGVVVNSFTTVNPTTITINLSTVGAALGPQDVTVTNPDGQSLTGTGLITVTSGAGAPTCVVSSSAAATNLPPLLFTMTFDEAVTGFSSAGVTLTNGSAGVFTPLNASTYTLAVTPVADGPVTCQVTTGAALAVSDNQPNLSSNIASVLFDTVPPTAPGTPAGLPNPNAGNFTVNWAAATDSGSGVASYTVERADNGGAFAVQASGVTTLMLAQSSLPQGGYQYRVFAVDAAGNAGPRSGVSPAVVVDLTPPGVPGTPSGTPNPNSTGAFTVSWTAAADTGGSGVASYTLQRSNNGAAFTTLASALGGLSFTQSGLAQGSYRYQVFAVDGAGNIGPPSAISPAVVVDTTAPSAPGAPAGSPNPNAGSFTVSWTAATDAGGSGVASYTVQRSDNGAAFATIATGISGLSLPQTSLLQGTYRYQVLAVDGAGNVGPASAISPSVLVDTTPPGAPGMPSGTPNPNGTGTFTVSWTAATDAGGSGVASYTVQRSDNGAAFATIATAISGLSLPQTGLLQGTYRYQILAVDGVGNVGPPSPVSPSVVVDTTPPGAPGAPAGSPNPNAGTFTVSWTAATDAGGSGVASYTVQRSDNGAAFATIATGISGLSFAQSGLAQGSYRYQVMAVDGVGNVGPPSAISAAVVVVTTAPGAPGTPAGSPNPNAGTFAVSWTAAADPGGLGVASYTVQRSMNGAAFATIATGISGLSLAQASLVQGTYRYQVLAVDGVGNVGPASAISTAVVVDTTPPGAPGIPSGAPNPNNTGTFTVSWTAATDTGGSGIASYTVQRSTNGGAFVTISSGGAALSVNQTALGPGSYVYQVQPVDGVGNTGVFGGPSLPVIVDTSPPSAPGTPVGSPNPSSGSFTLTWTAATDTGGSGVATYTIQSSLNGGAFSSLATGVAGLSLAQNGLPQGSYRYTVQAVDAAGNVGPLSPPSLAVVVLTTAPHTTILAKPPNPSSSPGATFLYSSTVADSTFQTKLDGAGSWTSTGTSPTISYSGLANGSHTFQVRAVDAAGNVDPAPPSYVWTVNTSGGVTQGPDTILTGQPSNPTAQTTATFTFISTEGGGTFDVQIDAGGWSSNGASGTKTYTGLSTGTHTFQVRAVDAALNVDATPASFTWTIVTPPVDQAAPFINSFSDDVALTHWTISSSDPGVTWAVDGTPASMPGNPYFSAPSSLNYNNGTNYDTPGLSNRGTATSPSITLGGLTGARLKFFCNYQTETTGIDHDVRFVQVSSDGFTTTPVNEQLSTAPGSVLAGSCSAMGAWHEHVIGLGGLTGPIQVRFLFDTVDAGLNDFAGWFVDDFEISDLFVSGLQQTDPSTGALVPVGGTVSSTSVTVGGVVSRDAVAAVTLEIEVQPVGTPFTGVANASATGSGPGSVLGVPLTLAGAGSYHWQARTVTGGVTSSWMSFGLNAESDPDFITQSPVASAAPAGGGGGGGGGGGCGLTGWEAMILLAASLIARKCRKPSRSVCGSVRVRGQGR